jgi:hypothetical protein
MIEIMIIMAGAILLLLFACWWMTGSISDLKTENSSLRFEINEREKAHDAIKEAIDLEAGSRNDKEDSISSRTYFSGK